METLVAAIPSMSHAAVVCAVQQVSNVAGGSCAATCATWQTTRHAAHPLVPVRDLPAVLPITPVVRKARSAASRSNEEQSAAPTMIFVILAPALGNRAAVRLEHTHAWRTTAPSKGVATRRIHVASKRVQEPNSVVRLGRSVCRPGSPAAATVDLFTCHD